MGGAMKLAAIFLVLLVAGCATSGRDFKQESANKFNQWLGKSKDERVKVLGPPERCTPLDQGGEVCQWVWRGMSGGGSFVGGYAGSSGSSSMSTWEAILNFTYDHNHVARFWSFRAPDHAFTSNDYQQIK